jgi:hypothetical protein
LVEAPAGVIAGIADVKTSSADGGGVGVVGVFDREVGEGTGALGVKRPLGVDPALSGEMRLYKKGGKVVFAKESKLYSLSLK